MKVQITEYPRASALKSFNITVMLTLKQSVEKSGKPIKAQFAVPLAQFIPSCTGFGIYITSISSLVDINSEKTTYSLQGLVSSTIR